MLQCMFLSNFGRCMGIVLLYGRFRCSRAEKVPVVLTQLPSINFTIVRKFLTIKSFVPQTGGGYSGPTGLDGPSYGQFHPNTPTGPIPPAAQINVPIGHVNFQETPTGHAFTILATSLTLAQAFDFLPNIASEKPSFTVYESIAKIQTLMDFSLEFSALACRGVKTLADL